MICIYYKHIVGKSRSKKTVRLDPFGRSDRTSATVLPKDPGRRWPQLWEPSKIGCLQRRKNLDKFRNCNVDSVNFLKNNSGPMYCWKDLNCDKFILTQCYTLPDFPAGVVWSFILVKISLQCVLKSTMQSGNRRRCPPRGLCILDVSPVVTQRKKWESPVRVSTGNRSIMSNPSIAIADEKRASCMASYGTCCVLLHHEHQNAQCTLSHGKRCLRVWVSCTFTLPDIKAKKPWYGIGMRLGISCRDGYLIDESRNSRLLLRDPKWSKSYPNLHLWTILCTPRKA